MNASKIRIHADLIAANIQHIAGIAGELRRSYDTLYDELRNADPQQDRPFEYFMLHLTRTLHALQSDHITSLAVAVAAMRDYPSNGGRASRELAGINRELIAAHGAAFYAPELAKSHPPPSATITPPVSPIRDTGHEYAARTASITA